MKREGKNEKNREILIALTLLGVIVNVSACNNEEDKVGEIAMVIDSNLEKVEETEIEQERNGLMGVYIQFINRI